MSELALTLMRLGFLVLLWIAVFSSIAVLRRDLTAPREARALAVTPSSPGRSVLQEAGPALQRPQADGDRGGARRAPPFR